MARFLLIGLDGAEPSLVEQWMGEGRLPQLARLAEAGSFLPLQSTRPPATFPAWTTCVTGVNPGKHGIVDFTEVAAGTRAIRFINSTFRKAPAIWNVLSDAGRRTAMLGIPATYPPEPVNGIMVSGFDSPVATRIDASFVYPPERYPEVRDWRFADLQETNIGPGWHDRALPLLLEKIGDKERIACELLRQEPWDFFMIVFSESDTAAHHFWLFHDPDSPRHRPGHADAIRLVYERLDGAVGRLVEAAGEGVVVGIVSDHGFGGAGTGVVHLNNWLAEQGYLRFQGAGRESLLKRAALTLTPERWRGALFRRFRNLATRAESASRFGGIDWSRTMAWSEELNYFPSIRVNLAGRDPAGQVPADQYESFVRELCARLEEWEVIARAWPRWEVFEGPYADRAPDIVIELKLEEVRNGDERQPQAAPPPPPSPDACDGHPSSPLHAPHSAFRTSGYSHSVLRSRGGAAFRRIGPEEYLGGKERGMNGNHRPVGTLILSEKTSATEASLQDSAPTVLATLGVAGPPMDGQPLLGRAAVEESAAGERPELPYSPEQERILEERLRALGYFE
ncbi:MAG: alkaline phosphatase family protein [Candidatus Hydrogenedentes bacterium]|nr:alkaline phosphatase family protein [Candidatus Hydrogenedentota bacterium]